MMRTNIVLDEKLMAQAMRASGLKTKRATIEAALKLLIQTHGQTRISKLRGKVQWEGDLDESRLGRIAEDKADYKP